MYKDAVPMTEWVLQVLALIFNILTDNLRMLIRIKKSLDPNKVATYIGKCVTEVKETVQHTHMLVKKL